MPKLNYGNYGGANVNNAHIVPKGYTLKVCSLCPSKAIFYAGPYAFCFDHKAEARAATQRRLKTYPAFIESTMRDLAQPYELSGVIE